MPLSTGVLRTAWLRVKPTAPPTPRWDAPAAALVSAILFLMFPEMAAPARCVLAQGAVLVAVLGLAAGCAALEARLDGAGAGAGAGIGTLTPPVPGLADVADHLAALADGALTRTGLGRLANLAGLTRRSRVAGCGGYRYTYHYGRGHEDSSEHPTRGNGRVRHMPIYPAREAHAYKSLPTGGAGPRAASATTASTSQPRTTTRGHGRPAEHDQETCPGSMCSAATRASLPHALAWLRDARIRLACSSTTRAIARVPVRVLTAARHLTLFLQRQRVIAAVGILTRASITTTTTTTTAVAQESEPGPPRTGLKSPGPPLPRVYSYVPHRPLASIIPCAPPLCAVGGLHFALAAWVLSWGELEALVFCAGVLCWLVTRLDRPSVSA